MGQIPPPLRRKHDDLEVQVPDHIDVQFESGNYTKLILIVIIIVVLIWENI